MKQRLSNKQFLASLSDKIETPEDYITVLKAYLNNDINTLESYFGFRKAILKWSLLALNEAERRLFDE